MTIGTIRYVLAPEFDSCFLINSIIVNSSFCNIYIKLSFCNIFKPILICLLIQIK